MSQTFNNTRISLDKVLANVLAENEDDFTSELSENCDDDFVVTLKMMKAVNIHL